MRGFIVVVLLRYHVKRVWRKVLAGWESVVRGRSRGRGQLPSARRSARGRRNSRSSRSRSWFYTTKTRSTDKAKSTVISHLVCMSDSLLVWLERTEVSCHY
ncbi:hypothetical protein BO99DRAFT_108714 [Aspergillus violaceofuscus CBS 115571]|uniref:Uncharacterized protein n=1 Tax=Aspergillus violaceofuscus (strain CBS 115571) TaxID=1450538 RepID=A0A2V5HH14_ASPV1|nr:hypothetical protein BO99DRAFT_108714 [Aspergillus violaceofuscus CBS 115571]